jgi:hypothetical protein
VEIYWVRDGLFDRSEASKEILQMNIMPAILEFLMFAVPCFCGAMVVAIVCGGTEPKGPNPFEAEAIPPASKLFSMLAVLNAAPFSITESSLRVIFSSAVANGIQVLSCALYEWYLLSFWNVCGDVHR